MPDQSSEELLLSALHAIKPRISNTPSLGICSRVIEFLAEAGHSNETRCDALLALQALFHRWPKFSGNPEFPIPSTIPERSTIECYFEIHFHEASPYQDTFYALRLELLEFCIAELSFQLLRSELLLALTRISTLSDSDLRHGICYCLSQESCSQDAFQLFHDLTERWPKRAGDIFPVPSPSQVHSSIEMFSLFENHNYSTPLPPHLAEYARLRRELLSFCISELL